MQGKRILIASDHAGFQMKEYLAAYLRKHGYVVLDVGPNEEVPTDYPDKAYLVAQGLYDREADLGILICGTGIGMSIAVNKYNHIRGALVFTPEMAALARSHNNANVLILGGRTTPLETAVQCTEAFLTTPFEGTSRHERRVLKTGRMNHDFEK
ncbi:MAG: RpiB/LacA/LacB family sugar-phosphate isomerase [Pseudomonadota bacterium]|nr:RpiB/LacA/LacB family sugar-phosphate isomerase [Pseudomonadota bacterium]